jgi:UDP-N-acetylglucosamine 2-epimerase (non-hydrolysing)
VGTNKEKIVKMVNQLLIDDKFYKKMSKAHNPYGDGNSSNMICDILVGEGGL